MNLLGKIDQFPDQHSDLFVLRSGQRQERLLCVGHEPLEPPSILEKELPNRARTRIANHQPYDLGRRSMDGGQLAKVGVLRNQDIVVITGEAPDSIVALAVEPDLIHVPATRVLRRELIDEGWAQVLVEKQLHPPPEARRWRSRRSRAAAKARAARMCSGLRLGKSLTICSSVMPPARYSRMS